MTSKLLECWSIGNKLPTCDYGGSFPGMTLPEELQAKAARRLADAAARLKEAEAEVRGAVLEAKAAGLSVNRSAAVAEVHRSTVYRWLREAEQPELDDQGAGADDDAR